MSDLDRICDFPRPWQEIAEAVGGVAIGHPLKDVGEICVGFDTIEFRAFDQRAEDGPAFCASIAACKQMVLAAKGDGADGAFDRVGIEFPVFSSMYSEGMYGLFLYSCEALRAEGMDVVFWSPLQVKAHARDTIDRPRGWRMDKVDMCEAAKLDAAGGQWNHNEADAYLVGVLSARFWGFYEGTVGEGGLTTTESRYFTKVHTFQRGRKAGRTVKKGVIHREQDRFFRWSRLREEDEQDAKS